MLNHRKQPHWYGCFWHACAAITGNPDLMEHQNEGHPYAAAGLLLKHGWFIEHLSVVNAGFEPLQADQWAFMAQIVEANGDYGTFLAHFELSGSLHAIAIEYRMDGSVLIANSALPELELLSAAEAQEKYGQPYQLDQLIPVERLLTHHVDLSSVSHELYKADPDVQSLQNT